MAPSSPTARRAGITPDTIAAAATDLARQRGLDGWSMRELALSLGVVPSVLYHHTRDKTQVQDLVVERLLSQVPLPDEELEWKQWYTELAWNLRPVLREFHGVTERMKVGHFSPSSAPILDIGTAKLVAAGFGDNTALAHAMIFNTIVHTISARNMRTPHRPGPHHDVGEMIARLEPAAADSPGLKIMMEQMFRPLADPAREEDASRAYYGAIIAAILNGVEHTLL